MPREAKMNAKVGGEYEFRYYWPAKKLEATAKGKILDLVPSKRLSYSFESSRKMSDPRTTSVVTWTLDELPSGKTLVTLVHSGITEQGSGDTDMGWGYYATQLAEHCSKMMARGGIAHARN